MHVSPALAGAVLVLLNAAAFRSLFLASSGREFLPYDDEPNFVSNFSSGWRTGTVQEQVTYAFNTTRGFVYEPIAWCTKTIQFHAFGLDASGMAGVNGAVHLLNELLVYAVLDEILAQRGYTNVLHSALSLLLFQPPSTSILGGVARSLFHTSGHWAITAMSIYKAFKANHTSGVGFVLRPGQRVVLSAHTLLRYLLQSLSPDPSVEPKSAYYAGTCALVLASLMVAAVALLRELPALLRGASESGSKSGTKSAKAPGGRFWAAAAWLLAVATATPTLSLFRHGSDSIGADRYTYLPSLPMLPLLAAAVYSCLGGGDGSGDGGERGAGRGDESGSDGKKKASSSPSRRTTVLACGVGAACLIASTLATAPAVAAWATPVEFYSFYHARAPSDYAAFGGLVLAHMHAGDGDAALAAADKGARPFLKDPDIVSTYTYLLNKAGRYADSVTAAQDVVRWTPPRLATKVYVNLANSYKHLGDRDMRLRMIRKAARSPLKQYQQWAAYELQEMGEKE